MAVALSPLMTLEREHLDAADLAEQGPAEAVRLPLDLVEPNPNNPRRDLREIEQLADSIRTFTLLQPVVVRREGEHYILLGGHRRRAAFALLREQEPHEPQWRAIPAVLRNTDDDDHAYLMLLTAQLHTSAWRPREEAAALERLVQGGRNLKQVGEALNRTEGWASRRLRVYADAVLSGYVQTGRLSPGVAEEFLPVLDPNTRKQMADLAMEEGWSQDKARGEVRALRLDRQIKEVAKRARELLEILSQIDATRLPPSATKDLWTLRGRIDRIGRGGPVIPSIEQAQRAAGVSETPRRTRGRPKGSGRKQRAMPKPA